MCCGVLWCVVVCCGVLWCVVVVVCLFVGLFVCLFVCLFVRLLCVGGRGGGDMVWWVGGWVGGEEARE